MVSGLYGYLTLLSFVLVLVFAAVATVFVNRLLRRPTSPIGEQIGSSKAVVAKLRKREAMSRDELEYARQVVTDRSSLMAYAIPGALFSVGCFFVFGSLEQLHGATPSERTFLGVFPMLAATNFTIRMLISARLKGRLADVILK
ncbi:hypothetical protein [Mycobacterium shimoidei]|uniref:Uncharacterized protein n=1 Tax=Mycobacterium shimoidei TaxID=29313 RepID=A0A1E3TLL6_MYCSH|nr:hypothetical protein [Mycobacterium shimoidei]MCV7258738.1 hypothetical protein [Mycobacterium shimoidei]ODR15348.1 hypothetical protein BHQ16_01000 [Mycobacterium shimoidei]ORW79927.1 hypothetical protein AWC26_13595 [Mycobacterium shimoidei]SRX92800.1 hypothetical protein MSP7336_01026 [Mycobacterium shimoidei]